MVIGRGEGADIHLDNPAVSRRHAVVRKTAAGYEIEDVSGKNGLVLNGRPIMKEPLKDGDRIEILKFTIRFEYPAEEAQLERAGRASRAEIEGLLRARTSTADLPGVQRVRVSSVSTEDSTTLLPPKELEKVRTTMAAKAAPHFAIDTNGAMSVYKLQKERTTIGKAAADIVVPGGVFMSDPCAEIRAAGGRHSIVFLGGWSVPTVNGEKLKQGVERPLRDGDMIVAGPSKLRYNG